MITIWLSIFEIVLVILPLGVDLENIIVDPVAIVSMNAVSCDSGLTRQVTVDPVAVRERPVDLDCEALMRRLGVVPGHDGHQVMNGE